MACEGCVLPCSCRSNTPGMHECCAPQIGLRGLDMCQSRSHGTRLQSSQGSRAAMQYVNAQHG